jgi:hypothetical protein
MAALVKIGTTEDLLVASIHVKDIHIASEVTYVFLPAVRRINSQQ